MNDADDAAGYVPRESGGDVAYNAGGKWYRGLRSRKERGLPPSQALSELSELPGGYYTGQIVPDSTAEVPDLETLRERGRNS